MKNIILASGILALSLQPMQAGGLAEPVMDAEIVMEESASSSSGYLVPLLLLAAVVLVASSNGSSAPAASDERLKEDITLVGAASNGLPLYHFSYIGMPGVFEGVMAQDVLMHTPEAVVEMGGYYGVNYEMLGLEMRRIK